MTALADHLATEKVDADPALEVDGLSVDIRTITGTVRAVNDASSITGMTLEHYPGMTEAALEEEAAKRLAWVDLHRTSRPLLGEISALREELIKRLTFAESKALEFPARRNPVLPV